MMEKVQKLYRHPLYRECLEKNKKAFVVMLPALISFLFVLLAPQIQGQPRYAFPIIYTMPLMIAFYQKTERG